jgi:hypothetical protein
VNVARRVRLIQRLADGRTSAEIWPSWINNYISRRIARLAEDRLVQARTAGSNPDGTTVKRRAAKI